MLTLDEARKIVEDVRCALLGEEFIFRLDPLRVGLEDVWFLQARMQRPDTETGQWSLGSGGKAYVSPHSTEDELVRKCIAACLAYAEHEVREGFTWRGKRIFGPHISLDALWEAADQVSYRK